MAARIAMMAMTTRSSTRVNAEHGARHSCRFNVRNVGKLGYVAAVAEFPRGRGMNAALPRAVPGCSRSIPQTSSLRLHFAGFVSRMAGRRLLAAGWLVGQDTVKPLRGRRAGILEDQGVVGAAGYRRDRSPVLEVGGALQYVKPVGAADELHLPHGTDELAFDFPHRPGRRGHGKIGDGAVGEDRSAVGILVAVTADGDRIHTEIGKARLDVGGGQGTVGLIADGDLR